MPSNNASHWGYGAEQTRQDLTPCEAYILQNAQEVYVALLNFLQSGQYSYNYDFFISLNPSR